MNKTLSGILFFMMALSFSVAQAWDEVAYETIFADYSNYHQIVLPKSEVEYREVLVQVMNPSGARIQRVEVSTEKGWSLPLTLLAGDYRMGMYKTDKFPKSKVFYFRTILTTLKPGEPVRLRVLMQ